MVVYTGGTVSKPGGVVVVYTGGGGRSNIM